MRPNKMSCDGDTQTSLAAGWLDNQWRKEKGTHCCLSEVTRTNHPPSSRELRIYKTM
jgi:hypothetical protein